MVTYILEDSKPLTDEEAAILEEAKKKPVIYDEDCPEMTSEMLSKFKRANEKSTRTG